MSDLFVPSIVLLATVILIYRLISKFAPQQPQQHNNVADHPVLKTHKFPRWLIAFLADAIFDGKWTTFTICGITIRFDDQEPPNFYYLVEDAMNGNRWYKLSQARLHSFSYDAFKQKQIASPMAPPIASNTPAQIQVSNKDAESYKNSGQNFTYDDTLSYRLPKKYAFVQKGGGYVVERI